MRGPVTPLWAATPTLTPSFSQQTEDLVPYDTDLYQRPTHEYYPYLSSDGESHSGERRPGPAGHSGLGRGRLGLGGCGSHLNPTSLLTERLWGARAQLSFSPMSKRIRAVKAPGPGPSPSRQLRSLKSRAR